MNTTIAPARKCDDISLFDPKDDFEEVGREQFVAALKTIDWIRENFANRTEYYWKNNRTTVLAVESFEHKFYLKKAK